MVTRRRHTCGAGQHEPAPRRGEEESSVTVVIPARNVATALAACLDGLAAEGIPGPGRELIVVDDASTDETRRVATRPGVCVLAGPGRGPAAARNVGARHASGAVLIFLDADTVPCAGWLAEMVAPLRDPEVVAVKGRYFTRQRSLVARFAQLEFEEKYARLARAARVDFVDSGTAAYRRDHFLAAGGFDEHFPAQSAEDVELAFRLAAQGARFVFNPRAGVYHTHASRLWDYLVKKGRYGFFRVGVYRKHPSKALGDSYTPPSMGVQIGLAALIGLAGIAVLLRRTRLTAGVCAGLATTFTATTLPLVRRAVAAHNPRLAALVPLLVYARAAAQGSGILVGLGMLAARLPHRSGMLATVHSPRHTAEPMDVQENTPPGGRST